MRARYFPRVLGIKTGKQWRGRVVRNEEEYQNFCNEFLTSDRILIDIPSSEPLDPKLGLDPWTGKPIRSNQYSVD